MILNQLEPLYRNVRNRGEKYTFFEFSKNNVKFDILFSFLIDDLPFELIFLQKNNNFKLSIEVTRSFEINPFLKNEDFKALCDVLGLKPSLNNKFSTSKFFEELNKCIPENTEKISKEQAYKFYKSEDEEPNKIYYYGKTEWGKNPNRKGNVSIGNLLKTWMLYPELYETCLKNNISIKYTSNKKDKNETKK